MRNPVPARRPAASPGASRSPRAASPPAALGPAALPLAVLPLTALPLAAFLLAATVGEVSAAGARLQVFFAADFKDQAYQQAVYQKVAGSWRRPARQPGAGSKSVVIAEIQRDGKAPDPRLHHPSGSQAWDDAAVAAVTNAAPFPPLPKTYAPAAVEVHFHFESVEEQDPAERRARSGHRGDPDALPVVARP